MAFYLTNIFSDLSKPKSFDGNIRRSNLCDDSNVAGGNGCWLDFVSENPVKKDKDFSRNAKALDFVYPYANHGAGIFTIIYLHDWAIFCGKCS